MWSFFGLTAAVPQPIVKKIFRDITSQRRLESAWAVVRRSATNSTSIKIETDAKLFNSSVATNIKSLQRALRTFKFEFTDTQGYVKGTGKKKRPLVVPSIQSRIVQRAILDVISKQKYITEKIESPYSYGGVAERDVKAALLATHEAYNKGFIWYAKADISKFFPSMPRAWIVEEISKKIQDPNVEWLIENSTSLEIHNLGAIAAEDRGLFDFDVTGSPQGCCLSPLLGNYLLSEFDLEMNTTEIKCFRYIDDFLILAKSRKSSVKALNKAIGLLKNLGLTVHPPTEKGSKTCLGNITASVDFLGINYNGVDFAPSLKACDKLVEKIQATFSESIRSLQNRKLTDAKYTYPATMKKVADTMNAWNKQYEYCKRFTAFQTIDSRVATLVRNYQSSIYQIKKSLNSKEVNRRIFGIPTLANRKEIIRKA